MQLFGSKKDGKHTAKNKAEEKETLSAQHEELCISQEAEPDEITQELRTAAKTETAEPVKEKEPSPEKKKHGKKKQGKRKPWKVILIILLILAVLAGGAYIAIEYFLDPPEVEHEGPGGDVDPGKHIENRKDGVYTFLVAGVDQISSNTDTIMIGMFDTVNHKLNIASIPRDTLINIQHEVKKANSAYHFAHYYSGIEGSSYYGVDPVESMRQELVKGVLGFDIDSYVLVNLDACAEVVDTIGGVEFTVPIDMNYDSKNQDLHIHISKGPQTLSGEQFVQVMRFRKAYSGGDLDRIKMQQKLLKALADQMLTLKNIPNVDEVITIIQDNMQTNMTTENMLYFVKEFLKLEKDDIEFMTMPKLATGSIYGQSYVFADIDGWLDMVNEYLNPWNTEIVANNLNMVTFFDGDFYSTTGVLAGDVSSFNRYSPDSTVDAAQVLVFESTKTQDKDVDNNDDTA